MAVFTAVLHEHIKLNITEIYKTRKQSHSHIFVFKMFFVMLIYNGFFTIDLDKSTFQTLLGFNLYYDKYQQI